MSKTLLSHDRKGISQEVLLAGKPVRVTELGAETPRSVLVPVMRSQEEILCAMDSWFNNCSPGSVVAFTIEPDPPRKKRR